ncbi:MAG: PilZ domain-containing protein [Desulfobulbaceae bacterium]|nr:MAG: PilZ domain-containing protein [Desulfobulbaceae bacterium]
MARTPYQIKTDHKQNRLYLTLHGTVSKSDMAHLYTDVRFTVADLDPGFSVITDLRACKTGALTALEPLTKLMGFLIENKVREVIRIVDEGQVISKQAKNLESQSQSYSVIYVYSEEEAKQQLTLLKDRENLRFRLLDHPVCYAIGQIQGQGVLVDISVGGCAVNRADSIPTQDSVVRLTINFQENGELLSVLDCEGLVIRSDRNEFAIAFQNLDEPTKTALWTRLVAETRCEIKVGRS